MRRSHGMKRQSSYERRQFFGIRKLKVGVASVTLATGLLFVGATSVVHAEVGSDAVESVVSTSELVRSTNDVVESADKAEEVSGVAVGDASGGSLEASTETEKKATVESAGAEAEAVFDGVEDATTRSAEVLPPDVNPADIGESVQTEKPIADGSIRVHVQAVDSEPTSYGLWTWGAVEKPSDGKKWPHDATPFVEGQKDDFGHYLDVKQAQTPGEIGYLILKDGVKIAEGDRKIQLVSPDVKEVWIKNDFSTYTYKPLEQDNVVRVHYKRDDNQYDGWGLWIWGDVEKASKNWASDALDFTGDSPYGKYVDVPLSKALDSTVKFLVVNKTNPDAPGNKTADMTFTDRQTHSHVFLKQSDNTVYTNPYYVAEVKGQDFEKATQGEKSVTVTATSMRAFHYNETGIVDVRVDKPSDVTITKMEVDTTILGGGKINISPELNRVTITASSEVAPGEYDLPVRAYDSQNGYYDSTVKVTINPREKKAGEKDWDEQVIYFMVTDRFSNGDKTNDNPYNQPYDQSVNKAGNYKGGDFKGVTDKLDYLKSLGVDSIWVTPIVENVPQNVSTEAGKEYYAYHGYWAKNFEELNPHLGTLQDFHHLIDKAAEKGINIIVDVVLNHAGYGAEETFAGKVRTKEEDKPGDDQKGSLANLPDFKTEDHAVREKLVAWQADWLRKAKTPNGNSIYAFRVDTVKHVDDTTWQHFKNELAVKDADFHLVGETWGANYKDTKGDLGAGTMDSLLDFGFKDIAKLLVNGQLKAAEEELIARNNMIKSHQTLAQFLGSHDEDGFLHSVGGDVSKLKLAASLLLTAKGQPVIYYGEELGQTGANNWPYYDNRYDFAWDNVLGNDILAHYQKVSAFRQANSQLLSKGERTTVAVNDSEKWLLTKRFEKTDSAYVLFNGKDSVATIDVEVNGETAVVTDHYSGVEYKAVQNDAGKWIVTLEAPRVSDGGTMLLKVRDGEIASATSKQVQVAADEVVAPNHLRIHFKSLPDENVASMGLWTWHDVETPAKTWPNDAISFANAKKDAYGYYIDVKLTEGKREKVGMLVNNVSGKNLTEDKLVELLSPDMNEVWLDDKYAVHYYQPQEEGTIRINYLRTDKNYDNKALWVWGSIAPEVKSALGTFPNGINFENKGKYGAYIDVKMSELTELGFLLLDETKQGEAAKIQPKDYKFKDLKNHTQIFLKDDDPTIYTNPYFVNHVRLTGATQVAPTHIDARMTTLVDVDKETLLKNIVVTNRNKEKVAVKDLEIDVATNTVRLIGDFSGDDVLSVTYTTDSLNVRKNWQYTDALYAYDGELGARVFDEGARVDMTLWSPSASRVSVVLYDKEDQNQVVGKFDMTKGSKGEWTTTLNGQTGQSITDYRGYYYHYEIERNGETVLVLDPYAKSLAAWNSEVADTSPAHKVAKAAIVDVANIGEKDRTFASIPSFTSREDAIIYEAHVRDFTSDKTIEPELTAQFGTFAAFVDKLDYLQSLGVTHVQLLPVMSYYFVNELENGKRLSEYSSRDSNYNWGYDPQSYFALTGMYSTDPTNPAKRIEEFKRLVDEVHKRGMGVILDVVYNHTAKVDIFEDLEPNYYHFMDAQGVAKTSFGGGRLGTTHHMARRVLVDSIKYLVDEYKVDGFRFDMMGDHDAESIQAAYDAAKALNPNVLMLGEGWVTYAGDDNMPVQPADQTWMSKTDAVASFSDDMRNTLKSGYPNEGTPAFLTGGARHIWSLFNNVKAQPNNFYADDPGDVIQYIAAHDNLTLFDIIAQSIKKDPSVLENNQEIHRRLRLGNTLVLTSQGTPFIHSGQEYGRTKQFLAPSHQGLVAEADVPNKSHVLTNVDGTPFNYPYFIHDSYDSSDAINQFDWKKALDDQAYPENTRSREFTTGLITLRRSTDAFRLKTRAEVDQKVKLISVPHQSGVGEHDVVIAYQVTASNGDVYAVFVNADTRERHVSFGSEYTHLKDAEILVDGERAGVRDIADPVGVRVLDNGVHLAPLTATVLRVKLAQTSKGDSVTREALPTATWETGKGDSVTREALPAATWETGKDDSVTREALPTATWETGKGDSVTREALPTATWETGKGDSVTREALPTATWETGKGDSVTREALPTATWETGKGDSVTREALPTATWETGKGDSVTREALPAAWETGKGDSVTREALPKAYGTTSKEVKPVILPEKPLGQFPTSKVEALLQDAKPMGVLPTAKGDSVTRPVLPVGVVDVPTKVVSVSQSVTRSMEMAIAASKEKTVEPKGDVSQQVSRSVLSTSQRTLPKTGDAMSSVSVGIGSLLVGLGGTRIGKRYKKRAK